MAAAILVIKLWRPNTTLRDVDKQWCEEFIVWQLNDYVTFKGTKPNQSTVVNYLKCLRSAFNQAVDNDIVAINPIYRVKSDVFKQPESKREFLTVEEVKKLIDTPSRRIMNN